jgi:hypothetical protein
MFIHVYLYNSLGLNFLIAYKLGTISIFEFGFVKFTPKLF